MTWTDRLRRGRTTPTPPTPIDELRQLREEDLTDGDRQLLGMAYGTYQRVAQEARDETDPLVAHYIDSLAQHLRHKGEEALRDIATERLSTRVKGRDAEVPQPGNTADDTNSGAEQVSPPSSGPIIEGTALE